MLAHVPASEIAEVAGDLKAIFSVHRKESADTLAEAFVTRYQKRFAKAAGVLKGGLDNALTFLAFPTGHQRLIRSTNSLERLFGEVKRRTRVVGVFPNETSATNLCTAVMLRATEDWALKRYLDMEPLRTMNEKTDKTEATD